MDPILSVVFVYLLFPEQLMTLYELQSTDGDSIEAMRIAAGLLGFVSLYLVLDTIQIIVAGALRGAGDTWFVLGAGLSVSVAAIMIGIAWEPTDQALNWWWWIITFWIGALAAAMVGRFLQGSWKQKRMV